MGEPIGAKFPWGPADEFALAATGAQSFEISNSLTFIDGVTAEATGNRTINLTAIHPSVTKGAKIIVKLKTAATQTTTFGTGFTAPVITGVAGKTIVQEFIYDGTQFIPSGAELQID